MFSGLNHGEELVVGKGMNTITTRNMTMTVRPSKTRSTTMVAREAVLDPSEPGSPKASPEIPHPGRKQVIGDEADGRSLIQFHQGDLLHLSAGRYSQTFGRIRIVKEIHQHQGEGQYQFHAAEYLPDHDPVNFSKEQE